MEAIGNPYLLAWDNLHIGPEQLQMSLCATPNARSKAKKPERK